MFAYYRDALVANISVVGGQPKFFLPNVTKFRRNEIPTNAQPNSSFAHLELYSNKNKFNNILIRNKAKNLFLRVALFNYQTPKKVGPHIKNSESTCHEYHFCQRDHGSISHLFSSRLISKSYS
jgi:hypothetical protein